MTPAQFAPTVYARIVERMAVLQEPYHKAKSMASLEFSVGDACWEHVEALHEAAQKEFLRDQLLDEYRTGLDSVE